jgi:hypothetical protein
VNFQGTESAVPTISEIEDRHVEHEHWVMHSPATRGCSSTGQAESSRLSFHFCLTAAEKLESATVRSIS